MATQILRTINRWRFEAPLALALAGSAAFVTLVMPGELFGQVPVAGPLGLAGRLVVSLLLALALGGIGYWMMRRTGHPVAKAVPVEEAEEISEEDLPSGMPSERLRRFRRADAHPDAPPREPIIASRDLGEPFMEVGAFAPPPLAEPREDTDWWPEETIPHGDFVEVGEETGTLAEGDIMEDAPKPAFVESTASFPSDASEPDRESPPAPRPMHGSITAMMDRLSAGLERRETRGVMPVQPEAPARDIRPALRDALDELNRLAERRH
jgi:hypothetical protein